MNRVLIVIQARFDSSRCPGKILRELKGKTTSLSYLGERIASSSYNFCLATSDRKEDNELAEYCTHEFDHYHNFIGVERGSYSNIALRLYKASKGYEYIVRITGDDIFTDIEEMERLIEWAKESCYDYSYQPNIIRGIDCEIIKRSSLKKAMELYDTSDFESIEFLFRNKDIFSVGAIEYDETLNMDNLTINLSMDTEDDFKLIKIVYDNLHGMNRLFSGRDIAYYLSRNKHLLEINKVPKLSIYMLNKNYSQYIAEALDSVLKQSYTDYELILIDYGSDDIKHVDKISKYINDDRVIYKKYENLNFIDAIKQAIKLSRGKYIMRVDADDRLRGDAVKTLVDYIQKNEFYSGVIPDYWLMDIESELYGQMQSGSRLNLPTCAMFEKKKLNHIEFIDGQTFRDGTSLIKSFKSLNFKIGYLKEPLFYYRVHDKSLTNNPKSQAKIKAMDKRINAGN